MLDLYQDESDNAAAARAPTQKVDPTVFQNFMEGTGKVAMSGFAKAARALSLAGSVVPRAVDELTAFTMGTKPPFKRLEATERYFKFHDEVFGAAVDYWTPKPNEVGVAAEVAGSLLSMLPMVVASPAATVASAQLSAAEDLSRKYPDVTPLQAQGVGAAQAVGLGLGIWMPIVGNSLATRVLAGGAGFNVVQGMATRAASGAILGDSPAAQEYQALDPKAITLDTLLGLAFGAYAHISPAQRAQGAEFWNRMGEFMGKAKPSEVDALGVLRLGQHINHDSMPGRPVSEADVQRHVDAVRSAIDSLARDNPVDVESSNVNRETYGRNVNDNNDMQMRSAEAGTQSEVLQGVSRGSAAQAASEVPRAESVGKAEVQLPGALEYAAKAGAPGEAELQKLRESAGTETPRELSRSQERGVDVRAVPQGISPSLLVRPGFYVDPAKEAAAREVGAALQTEAPRIRAEEGIPGQRPPNDITALDPESQARAVGQHIETQLIDIGMQVAEARANAAIWGAFAKSAHQRYGITPAELMARYGVDVRRMDSADQLLGALEQADRKSMGYQRDQVAKYAEQIGMEVDSFHGSGLSKSEYLVLRYDIKRDADGTATDWKTLRMRFSDHDLPPSYKRLYGDADFEVSPVDRMDATGKTWADAIKYLSDLTGAELPAAVKRMDSAEISRLGKSAERSKQAAVKAATDSLIKFDDAVAAQKITAFKSKSSGNWRIEGPVNSSNIMVLGKYPGEEFSTAAAISKARDLLQRRIDDARDGRSTTFFQSDTGPFYSELTRQVDGLKINTAPAKGWLDAIKGLINKGVVKPAEVEAVGLREWLDLQDGKVRDARGPGFGNTIGKGLDEVVGKDIAEKILAEAQGKLSGEGLKVGGEGMKAFYDRIIPNIANDVLKKLGGGKVGDVELSVQRGRPTQYADYAEYIATPETQAIRQSGFDVTPQLRDRAMAGMPLFQPGARGAVNFETGKTIISLFENADRSTFQHETGHVFLEMTKDLASRPDAPVAAMQDWATIARWLKIEGGEIPREAHEQWARGWEKYLAEGVAPNEGLKSAFRRFRDWLLDIYKSLTGIDSPINNEIRGVMARMLDAQARDPIERGGLDDARLRDPEYRRGLEELARSAGWAETSGLLIRDPITGEASGRTTWVAHAEWYRSMQQNESTRLPGGKRGVDEAVRKALMGETMTAQERRAVTTMLDEHAMLLKHWEESGAHAANPDGDPFEYANAQRTHGIDSTPENTLDMALIDRAREVAPEAVDAIPDNFTDAQYMASIRGIIDGYQRATAEIDQGRQSNARGPQESATTGQVSGAGRPPPGGAANEVGGKAGTDMLANEAQRIADTNPDLKLPLGTAPDGTPIYMTMRELLDEAAIQRQLAEEDASLFAVAAECLIGLA